jgi:hypothetical protein
MVAVRVLQYRLPARQIAQGSSNGWVVQLRRMGVCTADLLDGSESLAALLQGPL